MVQYPLMKSTVVVTCMLLSFPALAARVEVSSLPKAEHVDCVETLHVSTCSTRPTISAEGGR